jgi:hypothetical protein
MYVCLLLYPLETVETIIQGIKIIPNNSIPPLEGTPQPKRKEGLGRSSSSDAPVVDTEKSDHIGDVIVGEGDENGTMSVEADTVRQPASGEMESSTSSDCEEGKRTEQNAPRNNSIVTIII